MISSDELMDYGVNCVRCFTPGQFDDRAAATRALDALVDKKHFAKTKVVAVAVSRIERLHTFLPGAANDKCAQLASTLHRRWLRHKPSTLTVYWATKRTVRLLGGLMPGRLPNLDSLSHDLGCSSVAVTLFGTSPAFRHAWIPEEIFRDVYGQAKPDAALADETGITTYIEFAGRYTCERLTRLQQFATDTSRPLQLFTIAE